MAKFSPKGIYQWFIKHWLALPKRLKLIILIVILVVFIGAGYLVYGTTKTHKQSESEIQAQLNAASQKSDTHAKPTFTSSDSIKKQTTQSPTDTPRSSQSDPNPPKDPPKNAPKQ